MNPAPDDPHDPGDFAGSGEWFRDAFRGRYLDLYAHRDAGEATRLVDLVARHAPVGPDVTVFDAPCGGGRHARAFAARGCRVTAMDLSTDLLKAAAADRVPQPGAVAYHRADIRALAVAFGRFDIVANLFSSLGYFDDDRENLTVIDNLTATARAGGLIVIDFMNADWVKANLVAESTRELLDGGFAEERRAIVGSPGHERVEKRVTLRPPPDAPQPPVEIRESVRLFTPDELAAALTAAGARVLARYGDYDGGPPGPASPRAILVVERT